MAKFGRFDPRNKKQGRNKQKSLYKDIRMHEVEKNRRILGVKVTDVLVEEVEEDIWNEDESV